MRTVERLPWHCLSVPGCRRPRLAYAGYCAEHGPPSSSSSRPRCVAPLRCYCPGCVDYSRYMLGPHVGPEAVRQVAAALAARSSLVTRHLEEGPS